VVRLSSCARWTGESPVPTPERGHGNFDEASAVIAD
jgi:hypothetical protein